MYLVVKNKLVFGMYIIYLDRQDDGSGAFLSVIVSALGASPFIEKLSVEEPFLWVLRRRSVGIHPVKTVNPPARS